AFKHNKDAMLRVSLVEENFTRLRATLYTERCKFRNLRIVELREHLVKLFGSFCIARDRHPSALQFTLLHAEARDREKSTLANRHGLSFKGNLRIAAVHLEPWRLRIDAVKTLLRQPDLRAHVNQHHRIVTQWDIVRLQNGG